MMDVKVSKNKHISKWADPENLIYIRWNRIKIMHIDKKGDQEREKKYHTEWSKTSWKHK